MHRTSMWKPSPALPLTTSPQQLRPNWAPYPVAQWRSCCAPSPSCEPSNRTGALLHRPSTRADDSVFTSASAPLFFRLHSQVRRLSSLDCRIQSRRSGKMERKNRGRTGTRRNRIVRRGSGRPDGGGAPVRIDGIAGRAGGATDALLLTRIRCQLGSKCCGSRQRKCWTRPSTCCYGSCRGGGVPREEDPLRMSRIHWDPDRGEGGCGGVGVHA